MFVMLTPLPSLSQHDETGFLDLSARLMRFYAFTFLLLLSILRNLYFSSRSHKLTWSRQRHETCHTVPTLGGYHLDLQRGLL